jgi:hypothetical protein
VPPLLPLLLMGPTVNGANESTAVANREIEQTTIYGRFMMILRGVCYIEGTW